MHRTHRIPAVRAVATGSALPGRDVAGAVSTNARLHALSEQAAEHIRRLGLDRDVPICSESFPEERIGVRERCVLDAELGVDALAVAAAKKALAASGYDASHVAEHLRVVVVASVSALEPAPAVATVVAGAVGASAATLAFDLVVGCSGFTAALECVRSLLTRFAPPGTLGLVVGAEAMTRVLDLTDRTTAPIFGDAAGALLVERTDDDGDELGIAPVETTTLPDCGPRIRIATAPRSHGPLLRMTAVAGDVVLREDDTHRLTVRMDGRRVFRDMTRTLPRLIQDDLERRGVGIDAFDRVVFHQANARLVAGVAEALDVPPERCPMNLALVGNTTSASLPLLLDEASSAGDLRTGERVLLVGFGTGYCVGITSMTWTPS